jgi:hypothetical protein
MKSYKEPQSIKHKRQIATGHGYHACNPSIQEDEALGLRVLGQPGLYSKILSQLKKKKKVKASGCLAELGLGGLTCLAFPYSLQ